VDQEPGEIREAIEQTRAQIGGTIEAIADKADVKARASDKVTEQREKLRATSSELRSKAVDATHQIRRRSPLPAWPTFILLAGATSLLLAFIARSRHRRGS